MPANRVLEYFVPMRDGIKLYTVLQLPEKEGKYPVIITRSPYYGMEFDFEKLRNADIGDYVILQQHCRGTARSEGECNAYLNERSDGLDLLDWVRKQPFYNGEIFLSGGSYTSSVHFAYMDTNPSDVKAAFLAVQDCNRYNICYRNGFFKSGLHGNWVLTMHKKNQKIQRNHTTDTFRTMPLTNITDAVFNEHVDYIEESFMHPDPNDPYWSTPEGGRDYMDVCSRCDIPIFLLTSFYDIYTEGVFDMWEKLSPRRRQNCTFVVTPYTHNYNPSPEATPETMTEFCNARLSELCPNFIRNWFDHFRKGTELSFYSKGKMIYYRLWDNQWITADVLKNGPVEKIFYLAGDRSLQKEKPQASAITYTYNPYAPAKFEGGVCNNFGGMMYQDPPNSRYDIISFQSELLEEEMICEGRIEVELHCSSTAEDSCFYIRLNLERNGKTVSLRDDIDSLCRVEKEYTPGEERVLKYTFAPHAFKLQKNDRLRLDVSSSCVPYFQVHTNHKGIQALQKTAAICRNTILISESHIRLYTLE